MEAQLDEYEKENVPAAAAAAAAAVEAAAVLGEHGKAAEACTRCGALRKQVQTLHDNLINAVEDANQYQVKYSGLRDEGQRLYQTYEVKCAKLKEARQTCSWLQDRNAELTAQLEAATAERDALLEAREVNEQLEEENQMLFKHVENLTQQRVEQAERRAASGGTGDVATQVGGGGDEEEEEVAQLQSLVSSLEAKARDSDNVVQSLQQSIEQLNREIHARDRQMAELTAQSKEANSPPFVLKIEVNPPPGAAGRQHSQEFDAESVKSMSPDEVRSRLDQLCISNELLRDEVQEYRAQVRKLENTARACEDRECSQKETILRLENELGSLNKQLSSLNRETESLRQSQETSERLVKETAMLILEGRPRESRSADQREREQSPSDAVTFEQSVREMCASAEQLKSEMHSSRLENELLREKLLRAEGEHALLLSELEQLRQSEKSQATQFQKQQIAYKNVQDDLRRMYAKHKKDLAELENKYHYEEYCTRYEKMAVRCTAMEKQFQATKTVAQRLHDMYSAFATLHSSILAKGKEIQQAQEQFVHVQRVWKTKLQGIRAEKLEALEAYEQSMLESQRINKELQSALEEVELRGRSLRELQEQLLHKDRVIATRTSQAVVEGLVSAAVLCSFQKELEEAREGVRESESLHAQLAEMAEREWEIVQSKTQVEKAAEQLEIDRKALQDELRRVQGLEINLESNQSELRRVKRAKEELADFIDQERMVNAEIMADLEKRASSAESMLMTCQDELAEVRLQLQTGRSGSANQIEELRAQLHASEACVASTTQRFQELLAKETDAKDKFATELGLANERIEELQAVVSRANSLAEARVSSSESLKLDLDIANEKIASLESEHRLQRQSDRQALEQAEEKHQEMIVKLEMLRKKAKAAEEGVRDVQARNNELLSELEEADAHSHLQSQTSADAIARIQSERDTVRSKLEKLEAQLARAQGRYEGIESRYNKLQVDFTHLEQRCVDMRRRLEQSMTASREANSRAEVFEKEAVGLKKRISELETDKEQLFRQTEMLRSSSEGCSSKSVKDLERENLAQRQLLEQERDRLRQYLLLYKDRGDKKLKSLNSELQRAQKRARISIQALEKCAMGLQARREVLDRCGLTGIASMIQEATAELCGMDS